MLPESTGRGGIGGTLMVPASLGGWCVGVLFDLGHSRCECVAPGGCIMERRDVIEPQYLIACGANLTVPSKFELERNRGSRAMRGCIHTGIYGTPKCNTMDL